MTTVSVKTPSMASQALHESRSRPYTHGSLFSGIGGFDLAADWMGWENVFHCEVEEYKRKRLEQLFKNSESYGDIQTFEGTKYKGKIDILSGGFPCQDASIANQSKKTGNSG